ncbi:pilus assembly protein TadG-related protein [Pelagovum pacificum]|nr:TadG family pilus assembly protein [Pelagovum pacificum]QQA43283.1 hypothetical protein I8N54_01550 [Pelagovum pacificum]
MFKLPEKLKSFRKAQEGAATVGGIFFTTTALILTGLALDSANAWQVQTQLQITADATALAAATRVDDLEAARALGLEVAAQNASGNMITDASFVFGRWDNEAGTFTETDTDPNAVQVAALRNEDNGGAIPTYLLKLVGINQWETGATSMAVNASSSADGGGAGPVINCNMMTVVSYGSIQTGGGNMLKKGVCIHGQTGVATGGGDKYDREVMFSAPHEEDIYIASYQPQNLPVEDITMTRSVEPVILPQLNDIWTDLWQQFYVGRPNYYYGNLLPDFMFEGNTAPRVVVKEGWWSIQPGEVQPNTIYVVNGGAQFSGGIDAQNVTFIVNGYFGVGGGFNLQFRDVFIMARQINLAGNITWGEKGTQCKEDHFSVYLMGLDSLSMGGWGNEVSTNGVIGISPVLNLGGNMKARNVYFETGRRSENGQTSMGGNNETSLGGDLSINGNDCSFELTSHYELNFRGDTEVNGYGNRSRLMR